MARIFLSHSSRDNASAGALKAWLDAQGFAAAFLDFDTTSGIPPGADWERTLYRELQRCQALVILQTPHWSASRWCFAEFAQARALGKPIFQVVDDDAGAAEPPIAADLQRLDLRLERDAGLEQLRRELERIALQDQGGFPWPPPGEPQRPPFPGLMVFEAEDAAVFFGRDDDWRAVIERLNVRRVQGGARLLVLQGASGSGKSSLLRAGVLPRLRRAGRQWLVLPLVRPGARPLEALARGLASGLGRPGDWAVWHRRMMAVENVSPAEPSALVPLLEGWIADLRQAANAPEAQLLVPIDQAEELFTVAETDERERFVAMLATALRHPLPIQALMTIRADAMDALQALTSLLPSLETLPLGSLSLERYREIIEGPARVAGLAVDPAFVARAIHDTATVDALPLLAFALRQMHDRFGADGLLSLRDYEALGDPAAGLSPLENAVRQAADRVLQPPPEAAALKALREAFVPALVRVGEQGTYTRRAASREALPEAARPLLEALVAARLLVRRQPAGEASTVEVAHEALLRVWPLLRGWLDASREVLLGSQQLEQDLALWRAAASSDKPRALLSGLKLARGRQWLREQGELLRPELRTFIASSQRRALWQRGVALGSVAAVVVAIGGAAGLAFWQLRQARVAQALRFEVTHQALLATDPFLSAVYGLAAAELILGQQHPWLDAQLSHSLRQAVESNVAHTAPIATGQGEVIDLVALPGGELISAGGHGTLRRWRNGQPLEGNATIDSGQKGVMSLMALPNGELISGGWDGTVRRWRDGRPLGPSIPSGQKAIHAVLPLRNGDWISASADGTWRLWREGRPLGPPVPTGQGPLWSLLQLRNGEVITGGEAGTLRRWRDGQPVGLPIPTGQGLIWSLLELRNGELISGGENGTMRRWRDGQPLGPPIPTGQEAVWSLLERANGEVISGGSNGTLRRWREGRAVDEGNPISTDQGEVHSLVEMPNGHVVSGGGNGTLRTWHLNRQVVGDQPIATGQGGIRSVLTLRNGLVVTGGKDGSLRRWRNGQPVGAAIPTGQQTILSLLERTNGELISGGSDGTLRRWRDGLPLAPPIATGQGMVSSLAELPNGELISGGLDGTLRRWRDNQPVGRPVATGQQAVMSLLVLRNGELISGGDDGTLRRWRDGNPVGGAVDTDQDGVWSLLERANGELISGGEDGTLRHWRDGRPLDEGVPIATNRGGGLRTLLELPNGSLLSGGADGLLRRWQEGRRVGDRIATGQGALRGLLLNGTHELMSAGADGTLRRWSLPAVVRAACAEIDLHSIATDSGLDAVVEAAGRTCRRVEAEH
ncbi:MAG: TIR domain-containing protein [Cyanobacteriota bacterium]|nr:TIR domain-containing protein [Cyanobacteriota bacterium]